MTDHLSQLDDLTNAEAHQLELLLEDLAMDFRGTKGDTQRREGIVQQYHEVLSKLYQNGRNPSLDLDSELPDKFMPEWYLKRTRLDR